MPAPIKKKLPKHLFFSYCDDEAAEKTDFYLVESGHVSYEGVLSNFEKAINSVAPEKRVWISLNRFKDGVRKPENWEEACGVLLRLKYLVPAMGVQVQVPTNMLRRLLVTLRGMGIPNDTFGKIGPFVDVLNFYTEIQKDPAEHQLATNQLVAMVARGIDAHDLEPGQGPDSGGWVIDIRCPHHPPQEEKNEE